MTAKITKKKTKNWESLFAYKLIVFFFGFTISVAAAPFVDNSDGTVTDIGNALIWQKCTNNLSGSTCGTGGTNQLTWANALTYCNGLVLAGKTWRLPNVTELRSIVDHSSGTAPVINTAIFPGTVSQYYWTSSSYRLATTQAWAINFQSGFTAGTSSKTTTYYVRCVASPP
ncbi:DUF1566 domain-containing protein [Leptospira weilii]|uniref:Lcl C-terminal domain-containing protein n=1 Tax=Leptospira weilii TaxID=28184 RepID=UPI0005612E20|nr:DUF1566 domain-containing protein [Leptospira weilii]